MGVYNSDWLLNQIRGTANVVSKAFKFETNDLGSRFVEINGVLIWANKYEIVYDNLYVMLRFFKGKKIVASVEAFGSSDYKKDEAFIIDDFRIISEPFGKIYLLMNITIDY